MDYILKEANVSDPIEKEALRQLREVYSDIIMLSCNTHGLRGLLGTRKFGKLYGLRGHAGFAPNEHLIGSMISWIAYIEEDLVDIANLTPEKGPEKGTREVEADLPKFYNDVCKIRTAVDTIKMSFVGPGAFKSMPFLMGFSCMSNEYAKQIEALRGVLKITVKDLEAIQSRLYPQDTQA